MHVANPRHWGRVGRDVYEKQVAELAEVFAGVRSPSADGEPAGPGPVGGRGPVGVGRATRGRRRSAPRRLSMSSMENGVAPGVGWQGLTGPELRPSVGEPPTAPLTAAGTGTRTKAMDNDL